MVRRSDGRWQHRIILDDGTVKYFYGKSEAALIKKIADYNKETEKTREKGMNFSVLADEWWNLHVSHLEEQTQLGYRPAYRRAKDYFKKRGIKQIAPPDINKFLMKIVDEKKISHKTARNYLSVIRQIFQYAVNMGYLGINPARDLTVPTGLRKGERDFPTDEEIKKVKESYDIPFGDFAYWCLYTGMRRSELLALTWEDIDMENRIITIGKSISRTVDHSLKVKKPKTEAGIRVIPILDKLYEKMVPGEGLVFPSVHGEPIPPKTFERYWANYQKATGITITPQCLRLAFCTMLYEADVDEKLAQELMGHASIQVTRDVYTRIRKKKLEKSFSTIRGADIL